MNWRLAIVLPLLIALAACGRGSLTRSAAADAIGGAKEFRAEKSFTFVVNGNQQVPTLSIGSNSAEGKLYLALQSLGYISLTRGSYGEAHVELTDKGRQAVSSRRWKGTSGGWGWPLTVDVPVVRPSLVEITGVAADDKQATVEFTWKYVLTDDGRQLQSSGMTFDPAGDPSGMKVYSFDLNNALRGSALFRHYDDGWRLAKLTLSA